MRRLLTAIVLAPAMASVVASTTANAAPGQTAAALRNMSLFWHSGRADNATCGSTACVNDQIATGGYSFVRVEGWVFP